MLFRYTQTVEIPLKGAYAHGENTILSIREATGHAIKRGKERTSQIIYHTRMHSPWVSENNV
jgi:hypothetical protein